MRVASVFALILILQLGLPAGLLAQTASEPVDLDLSSTERTQSAGAIEGFTSAAIQVGETTKTVSAHDLLTPAEHVALNQVVSFGQQTLVISDSGSAVGGHFDLAPHFGSFPIRNLVIPSGVTAVGDHASLAEFSLLGDLRNAGSLLAVSSSSETTLAHFSAVNIINQQSALISTITSGLPGLTSYGSIDLKLVAVENIVNSGAISSSGSLSMIAGQSIANLLPAGASSSLPSITALGSVSMQAESIINQGLIASQLGAITIATDSILNSGTIQSLAASLQISSLTGNSLVVNNAAGLIEAGNLLLLSTPGTMLDESNNILAKAGISALGGIMRAGVIDFTSPDGRVKASVDRLDGRVEVTGGTASIIVAGGTLNLAALNLTGDPIFANSLGNLDLSGLFSSGSTFSTSGEDFVALASGDIYVSSAPAGATILVDNTGSGSGNITIAAGADFSVSDSLDHLATPQDPLACDDCSPSFTINSIKPTGGSVLLSDVTITGTGNINIYAADDVQFNEINGNHVFGYTGAVTILAGGNVSGGAITRGADYSTGTGNISVTSTAGDITLGDLQTASSYTNTLIVDASGNITLTGQASTSNELTLRARSLTLSDTINGGNLVHLVPRGDTTIGDDPGPSGDPLFISTADLRQIEQNLQNIRIGDPAYTGNLTVNGEVDVTDRYYWYRFDFDVGGTLHVPGGSSFRAPQQTHIKADFIDIGGSLAANQLLEIAPRGTGAIGDGPGAGGEPLFITSESFANLQSFQVNIGNSTDTTDIAITGDVVTPAEAYTYFFLQGRLRVEDGKTFKAKNDWGDFMWVKSGSVDLQGAIDYPYGDVSFAPIDDTLQMGLGDDSILNGSPFFLDSSQLLNINAGRLIVGDLYMSTGPMLITGDNDFNDASFYEILLRTSGDVTFASGSTFSFQSFPSEEEWVMPKILDVTGNTVTVDGTIEGNLVRFQNNTLRSIELSDSLPAGGPTFYFNLDHLSRVHATQQLMLQTQGFGSHANVYGDIDLTGMSLGGLVILTEGNSFDSTAATINMRPDQHFSVSSGIINTGAITAGRIFLISDSGTVNLNDNLKAYGNLDIEGSCCFVTLSLANTAGRPLTISAGTLAPGADILSTNIEDYDFGSIIQPGELVVGSDSGNIIFGDNMLFTSAGLRTRIVSWGGTVTFGANNMFIVQGGNFWIDSTGPVSAPSGLTVTSVARYASDREPIVTLAGPEIRPFAGGGIAIYVNVPIWDICCDLFSYDDLLYLRHKERVEGGKLEGLDQALLVGSLVPMPANSGTIEFISGGDPFKIGIASSLFNADGGVISIDPIGFPPMLIDITNGNFNALGPRLGVAVVPEPPPPSLPLREEPPPATPGFSLPVLTVVQQPVPRDVTRDDPKQQEPRPPCKPQLIDDGSASGAGSDGEAIATSHYVASGACEPFVLEGDGYSAIIAANGTAVSAKPANIAISSAAPARRALSLREGKMLAMVQVEPLAISTRMGEVNVPAGSATIIECGPSGGMRVVSLSGGTTTITVSGSEKAKLAASPGQEIIIADESLRDEELIPSDGVDRQPISGAVTIAGLKVRQHRFDMKAMAASEPLLSCHDCAFTSDIKKHLAQLKQSMAGQTPVATRPLDAWQRICGRSEGLPHASVLDLVPASYAGAAGPAAASSLLQTMQTSTALIKHAGKTAIAVDGHGLVSLAAGEALVAASSDTIVRAGEYTISLNSGSVALIIREGSLVKVRPLWETSKGSVRAFAGKWSVDLRAGEEILLGPHYNAVSQGLKADSLARRRIRHTEVSGGSLAHSDVSPVSLIAQTDVLSMLIRSQRPADRDLAGKVMKMAACLSHVTSSHGAYTRQGNK